MLECDLEVMQKGGSVSIELQAGVDLHRVRIDLSTGEAVLQVVRQTNGAEAKEIAVQRAITPMRQPGKYRIGFANFDERLTLWINGSLPFGEGLSFPGPSTEDRAPRAGDARPIAIAARNAALKVSKLRIFRDIYYTRSARNEPPEYEALHWPDRSAFSLASLLSLTPAEQEMPPTARIERWDALGRQRPWFYPMGLKQEFGRSYQDPESSNGPCLGPDEYFALGDNSTRSSDSREWGQVPERLLLGKAVFVYWPLTRFGVIW
jgi:signal peptidase I